MKVCIHHRISGLRIAAPEGVDYAWVIIQNWSFKACPIFNDIVVCVQAEPCVQEKLLLLAQVFLRLPPDFFLYSSIYLIMFSEGCPCVLDEQWFGI